MYVRAHHRVVVVVVAVEVQLEVLGRVQKVKIIYTLLASMTCLFLNLEHARRHAFNNEQLPRQEEMEISSQSRGRGRGRGRGVSDRSRRENAEGGSSILVRNCKNWIIKNMQNANQDKWRLIEVVDVAEVVVQVFTN